MPFNPEHKDPYQLQRERESREISDLRESIRRQLISPSIGVLRAGESDIRELVGIMDSVKTDLQRLEQLLAAAATSEE